MDNSTEIIMKPGTPFCIDDGSTVFGSEYDVVMQAEIGGCHGEFRLNVGFLRPRWGRGFLSVHAIRGCRYAHPPANGLNPVGVPDALGFNSMRQRTSTPAGSQQIGLQIIRVTIVAEIFQHGRGRIALLFGIQRYKES